MADPTLSDLVAAKDEATVQSEHLASLSGAGFPVTAWPSSGAALALVKMSAKGIADAAASVAAIAAGGLLDYSEGDWLTLVAKSLFSVDRALPTFAVGTVRLTAAAGAGPYTIGANGLWVQKPSGVRYNSTNTGNMVLPAGGTLDIPVQAEHAGTAGNAAIGELTVMVTALAGVTASNPSAVTNGTDEESDPAVRTRCRTKWATLSFQGGPPDALDNWARTAAPNKVTRTQVREHYPTNGDVTLVLAGSGGGFVPDPDGVVAAVDAYVQARRTLCSTVYVVSATDVVVNVTADVDVLSKYSAGALARITAELTTEINAGVIGSKIRRSALIGAIERVLGVDNVDLGTLLPAGDVAVAAGQVAKVGVFAITVHPV